MKSSKYLSANIFAKLSQNWTFLYHFKALDSTIIFTPHFLNSADQIKISEMVFIHEMLLTQTLVSNHCCKLNSMSNNSCVCLVIARGSCWTPTVSENHISSSHMVIGILYFLQTFSVLQEPAIQWISSVLLSPSLMNVAQSQDFGIAWSAPPVMIFQVVVSLWFCVISFILPVL